MRGLAWLMLGAMACGGGSDGDDPTGSQTTDSGTTGVVDPSLLMLTDAHNYSFSSDLQIGTVEVAPATDLAIDWSAVTRDIRGRSVDPLTVQQLLLVELDGTPADVLQKIDANDLQQADALNQYLFLNWGRDEIAASEMSILGNDLDVELLTEDPSTTWLLSLANIIDQRFDFLLNTFVVPTTGATNTDVVFTDTSATLTFDADLQSGQRLVSAEGLEAYELDWSEATTDVFGRPLDLGLVTRVIVGKVGTDDIGQVEADFLQLYELADELYVLSVNGDESADLLEATLEGDDSTSFAGFTADGTWVVGVECTRQECTNPAPLLMAVVDVP